MIEDNSSGEISSEQGQSEQPDPIKNLKAEFARKQENVSRELAALQNQLSQIAETVISAAGSRRAGSESETDELPDPVVDPKGYKAAIARQVTSEVTEKVTRITQSESQKQAMLSQLVSNYPELQSADNELTQRAVQIYNGLSAQEKSMPASYKLAVQEAAQELGVLPVNKRKSNATSDESFTINSSSSGGTAPRKSQKKDEVDPKTIEFARLLGKDPSDPKYMEKLKNAAKRTVWSKYR